LRGSSILLANIVEVSVMKKMKVLYLLLGVILFILLFGATMLQQNSRSHLNNDINQDSKKNKPQRIVSMSPGNTEILFALGAGARVVGVSSYSDYPDEAKNKPIIGSYNSPDVEKIVALAPDIVFAMGQTQASYIHVLEQAGIHVVATEPQNLSEILTSIDIISAAIGEEEHGAALNAELTGKIDAVRQLTANSQPKRVFMEIWDAPLLTVGSRSFINDIINQAGGINVAGNKNVYYTPCDVEMLYAYNPEIYIVVSHSRKDIRSYVTQAELRDITAVKNEQVFPILDDLLTRPGPRSFDGLIELAKILHPEEMKSWEAK